MMAGGQLARAVDEFARLHLVVLGEAMLDRYLEGTSRRLCREAPVPIVSVARDATAPGGAANAAVNAARLGARVSFLSVVGDDADGRVLAEALRGERLETTHLLTQPGRRTLAKQRVLAESQLLVRFDHGSTAAIDGRREDLLLRRLEALWPSADGVIVSDYGYGILTPRVLAGLEAAQRRSPRVIVVDAKQLAPYRGIGITAVKPNYAEASALLGLGDGRGDRAGRIAVHGERILDASGARIAAVTLDADGAVFVERGQPPYRTYARRAPDSRAAGAGDTFAATLAAALAAGADTTAAAELAAAAAGVVVDKEGTATCSAAELRAAVTGGPPVLIGEALAARLAIHRRLGRRIVLTSGCFDLLHRGHVTYLTQAKALGDVLVVGLNTDERVRQLKGAGRPLNALEDRAQVLAALSCVDHVTAFAEDTPIELIRRVRPDIFVKGGDYTLERLPEAPVVQAVGGAVRILPYLGDRSTSRLIERIRHQPAQVA